MFPKLLKSKGWFWNPGEVKVVVEELKLLLGIGLVTPLVKVVVTGVGVKVKVLLNGWVVGWGAGVFSTGAGAGVFSTGAGAGVLSTGWGAGDEVLVTVEVVLDELPIMVLYCKSAVLKMVIGSLITYWSLLAKISLAFPIWASKVPTILANLLRSSLQESSKLKKLLELA